MISPERLRSLRRRWVRLLGKFAVIPAAAGPPFDRLVAMYSEPHRHYHTLEHLAEMFAVVDRLPRACADLRAVEFAVWFHDAVYDPRAKDNEERSALSAAECLTGLVIWPDVIDKVIELVRATAHLAAEGPPKDPDTAVLLDADLAVLGASEERYRRYAADIRKEYDFVPDDAYRAGRAGVLRRFLVRPRIYHHPVLVEKAEDAARRNMLGEIAELTGGSEPG